jgi:hypothetical protein
VGGEGAYRDLLDQELRHEARDGALAVHAHDQLDALRALPDQLDPALAELAPPAEVSHSPRHEWPRRGGRGNAFFPCDPLPA